MTKANQKLFNEAYCARVRALREGMDWSAEQMAKALGIPADRYRKYENRSPLPPYLIERFALIARVSIPFLLTGRDGSRRPVVVIDNKEFSDDGT